MGKDGLVNTGNMLLAPLELQKTENLKRLDPNLAEQIRVKTNEAFGFLENSEQIRELPGLDEYPEPAREQQQVMMGKLAEIGQLSNQYNENADIVKLKEIKEKYRKFCNYYESIYPGNYNVPDFKFSREAAEMYAQIFPVVVLADYASQTPLESFNFLLNQDLMRIQDHRDFLQDQDLMIHGVAALAPENIGNFRLKDNDPEGYFNQSPIVQVIRNGKLLSRVEQARADGESNFNTFSHLKSVEDETAEISFGKNFGYDSGEGDDFFYVVEDKRYMLATSAFYEADGVHVYDKDYKGEDSDSNGKAVDLRKDPIVLVMSAKYFDLIQKTMERHFGGIEQFKLWEGMTREEAEDWVAQNVVVGESISKVDEEHYDSATKFLSKLRNVYDSKFKISLSEGHFLPAGVVIENMGKVVGGRTHLVTYQTENVTVERNQVELQDVWEGKSNFRREKLDKLFATPKDLPTQLINFFRFRCKNEYESDSGVRGYTIEKHTYFVLKQFEKYFSRASLSLGVTPELLMSLIAIHDNGKPEAMRKGGKHLQHIYTPPIVEEILTELEFSGREIDIAKALVSEDPIGNVVKGANIDANAQVIIELAKEKNLPANKLFELMLILYQVDAGSYTEDAGGYPSLDNLFVFEPEKGKMSLSKVPQEKIDQLRNTIEKTMR